MPKGPVEGRFWSKVFVTDHCWEWTACTGSHGYGQIGVNGQMVLAHRFAYELTTGPIPGGLEVDHLCFNILCVNPDHLEAVTPEENNRRRWVQNS